jgi:EAL domain-containing protein (putative c-di-GMP-specific phosphodiesterase class I)
VDGVSELLAAVGDEAGALAFTGRALSAVLDLVGAAEGAAVELLDAQDRLRTVAAVGSISHQLGHCLATGRSLAAAALRANTRLSSDDTHIDPRVDRSTAIRFGVESLVCLPLRHAGGAIGALVVTSGSKAAFSPADYELVEMVADFVGGLVGAEVDILTTVAKLQACTGRQSTGACRAASNKLVGIAAQALGQEIVQEAVARRRIAEVIADKAVSIVCQPIVDLVSRAVVAVEALSRFPGQPERPPEVWFSQASLAGLSEELELMSLEAALEVFPYLPDEVSLSVNVGPLLLATDAMGNLLENVPPERLVIELTEHIAVEDYRALSRKVEQLRSKGIRLAIDDTGAGISSLAHILSLRPDLIKLDRSLVSRVDTDPARRALAVALVGFASEIGSSVVAEGIETEGELGTLQALGIVLGQGFYFGPPAPVRSLFPANDQMRAGRAGPRRSLKQDGFLAL